ncbi:hypothetical protein KTD33_30475 [Burkholderia gladioli]|uniref:hypothetical protein n=1 Tax=Burkholderia gladioli TaxID=28095 RepID=UPI001C217EDD|nr:hypothetical protein [Burkholderia gladioli]MBU9198855.1 hypothetical protein [Burkholderia gladioli]
MRKEYDLKTDALETIVATTLVTTKHAALVAALAARTDYRSARYVKTRDEFSSRPARVLDAAGGEVAADYYAWIDAQLAEHGDSVERMWAAFEGRGYLVTEVEPVLHYFVYDRSPARRDAQDDFVQIEVWEQQEFVERELFPRELNGWGMPSAGELRRGSIHGYSVERFERRELGERRYGLQAVTDMAVFLDLAESVWNDTHRRDGEQRLIERNVTTGQVRELAARELVPGYDRQRWAGRRFVEDWAASSAGQAGERICTRWVFKTSDYTAPDGRRTMSYIPAWTHTKKVAALENTHRLDDYGLYGKLNKLDERIGTPFAWFFYGLHGNLVRGGQLQRIVDAAEAGRIVLPEHDYEVLRAWSDDPYGF